MAVIFFISCNVSQYLSLHVTSCDCHIACKRDKSVSITVSKNIPCQIVRNPTSCRRTKFFCETKSMCFHEAYFLFYNFNFRNFRVNGDAPPVFLHNPTFVKLVLLYSEGQRRKTRSMQHSGISAGFFSSATGACIALLLPERFQITNDTACIRSGDKRPPLSAAHLDAQVPSQAEEVI